MKSKEAVNRRRDNTKAVRKITKEQRIIYKILYCCLRATRTPVQIGVNSCAPVVYAVVDPLVTVVVLILLRISDKSSVCGAYHKFVVGSRLAL